MIKRYYEKVRIPILFDKFFVGNILIAVEVKLLKLVHAITRMSFLYSGIKLKINYMSIFILSRN
jgi:hypothetical protein